MKMRRFLIVSAVAVCTALLPMAAMAQAVSPAIAVVGERAGGFATTLEVSNPRPSRMAVEIEIAERVFLPSGGEEEKPSSDFIIFPPQTVLDPEGAQNVRIQYVGEPLSGQSKSYRVWVREVLAPLSPEEAASSQVRVRGEFGGSLHLVPANVDAEPRIVSQEIRTGANGREAVLSLTNEGGRYFYLFETVFRAGDTIVPMDTIMETQNAGRPVGPFGSRTIAFPLPDGAQGASELTVEMLERSN
jgi:fimbrial chaperone protein